MIDITTYYRLLEETVRQINARMEGEAIGGVVLGVTEKHLMKSLREVRGVVLAASYPPAELTRIHEDNRHEENSLLLFLLEKVPSGSERPEEELARYARSQRVMECLKSVLMDGGVLPCGLHIGAGTLSTEWEYDIFGGYSGLSLGLTLRDYE